MNEITEYPLCWPSNWPRKKWPETSRFGNHSVHKAKTFLKEELQRLGAKNVVISTNLQLNLDGLPYTKQRKPKDLGVAVYFKLNNLDQCFPCDRWNKVSHNLYAIAKTIEALRGIDRWGSKHMLNATFSGFAQLPSGEGAEQIETMDLFENCKTLEEGKKAYREWCAIFHPDKENGSHKAFLDLQEQYDRFKRIHT